MLTYLTMRIGLTYGESLADRIRTLLCRRRDIAQRTMFCGIGFLLKGEMLVGEWESLAHCATWKPRYEQSLQQLYIQEFDITAPAMRGWVRVEAESAEDDAKLD